MTAAIFDEAERRQHFDHILRTVRSDLRNRFGWRGSTCWADDNTSVHNKLEAVAEDCFQTALQQATAHTPNKVFKRHAYALLQEAIEPEVQALDAAILQSMDDELADIEANDDHAAETETPSDSPVAAMVAYLSGEASEYVEEDSGMLPTQTVCCAVCGTEHKVYLPRVGDIGEDFEMAPFPVTDHPIFTWVQHCPDCGYCAQDISQAESGTAEVVTSRAYQKLVSEQDEAKLAANGKVTLKTAFQCKAIINETTGAYSQAAWSQLHTAWLFDREGRRRPGKRGRGKRNKAMACREKAVTLFARARQQGQDGRRRQALETVVQVDLLRRLGRFDEVATLLNAQASHDDDIQRMLNCQHKWNQQHDAAYHKLDEVPGLFQPGIVPWDVGCELY